MAIDYSGRASFAYVLVTTSSNVRAIDDVGVLGATGIPVFDTDLADIAFSSNISNDITWNQTAGTFTFNRAGNYHIMWNAITSQSVQHNTQTYTWLLGTTVVYTGVNFVQTAFDPVESTHQRILSVSANDVLTIKAVTQTEAMGIEKGTSLIITEITSDDFASTTVTTAGDNTGVAEFNPWDTDLGSVAFADVGKVASGIVWSDTAGAMTVPSDGKYFIMVNIIHQNGVNRTNTFKLKKGSEIIWTTVVQGFNQEDPSETTICIIQDLSASDVLTHTWSQSGTGTSPAVFLQTGATFTVWKLNQDKYIPPFHPGDFMGGFDSLYLSVVSKAQTTASGAVINPFKTGNYSSADFEVKQARGIDFNSASGDFTVRKEGLYMIVYRPTFAAASDAFMTIKIIVNGVVVNSASTPQVDSSADPRDITLSAFVALDLGDEIVVNADSSGPNVTHDAGTSITILRYYGLFRHLDILENTTGTPLLSDDNTINTYSRSNTQIDRNSQQAPFKFGIRGAGTIRNQIGLTKDSVVTLGDKKS